ncbi:YdeI/OmpD-associated family protein [Patescibacteria group bacterium]|nr:YdeI/OmpD-associated family protein [Patescibacteria group bacterium]MBU1754908.1 YdeI/OmpD-associated family protein [Patescibacteria group bacterium]
MSQKTIASGVAHTVPPDMRKVLMASPKVLSAWNNITPLARNEWICWTISVKQAETRSKHIQRIQEDLLKGKRRPCCWAGCSHR